MRRGRGEPEAEEAGAFAGEFTRSDLLAGVLRGS
jgi:hypothetical protein